MCIRTNVSIKSSDIQFYHFIFSISGAIIRARFTDEKALALISDSGGSVFELSLKKTLGMRSYASRCIFSGSRGEVCTFEPLCPEPNQNLPPSRIIVALATISKVIVLTIRPVMKVLFTFPLTGGPKTLPILSWQFVIIQTTKAQKVLFLFLLKSQSSKDVSDLTLHIFLSRES